MVFSSNIFLFIFLPLFFVVYFISRNRTWRNTILLLASLFFYAWGEPIYIFLMIFSIFINYVFALNIEKNTGKKKKVYFILIVLIDVLIIGVFKYSDFVIHNLNIIFSLTIPKANIPLPIGISFYTFQILSYVIDVYWEKIKVQRNLIYLGTYISSFSQLIAGPIVTYHTIELELENRQENVVDFASGVRRFIQGLFKKVVIANNVAFVTDTILSFGPEDFGLAGSWAALVAYTLQIYFDFSGYSDMAIGLGRMLGFHFHENFNHPYIAKSVTEFWRRWHISLTTFFREYIYFPLGGNRVSKLRWIRNVVVVWLLTGLWHGASWNFIFWGAYFCVFLLIEKFGFSKILSKAPLVVQHIYLMVIVIFGWVMFRIESAEGIVEIISAMFGAYGPGRIDFFVYTEVLQVKYIFLVTLGILCSTPIVRKIQDKLNMSAIGKSVNDISVLSLFIITILQMQASNFNPFIYFQF